MEKQLLRQKFQKLLAEMSPAKRAEKSKKACRNLISTPQFQKASVVMVYLSLPHEVESSEIILSAWQMGKTVVVPKISWQQRHMIPVTITTLDTGFSTEVGGLRNPITGLPVPFEEIDLVITPGLGFDRKGNRLGRGGAYFDKFFANPNLKASRCGFAFAEQVIDEIPATKHDQPVDFLVTDTEVIYIRPDTRIREEGDSNGVSK